MDWWVTVALESLEKSRSPWAVETNDKIGLFFINFYGTFKLRTKNYGSEFRMPRLNYMVSTQRIIERCILNP